MSRLLMGGLLALVCCAGCGSQDDPALKHSAEATPAPKERIEHDGVTYDLLDAGGKLPDGVRLAGAEGRGLNLLSVRHSKVLSVTPVRFSYMFACDISGDGKKDIVLSPYNVDFAPGLSWDMVATTLSTHGEGSKSPAIQGTAGDLFAPTCAYAVDGDGNLRELFRDRVESDTRCWADLYGNGMPVYCRVKESAALKTTELLGYWRPDPGTGHWREEPFNKEVPGQLRDGSAPRSLKGLLKQR